MKFVSTIRVAAMRLYGVFAHFVSTIRIAAMRLYGVFAHSVFTIRNAAMRLISYSRIAATPMVGVTNHFYYTTEKRIMLLQYTRVYRNGKRRVFKLV